MQELSTEGVCVRVWDWSETSQTASILTRDVGVVRVIAKGSKREKSDYSGGLEPATCGRLTARLKPGDGLSLLTSWDLSEIYPTIRRSLSAFHSALAMMDIIHHALSEQDPHPPVFDATVAALRGLTGELHADRAALLTLAASVLSETGHGPELDADVRTGETMGEARTLTFYPHLGGIAHEPSASGNLAKPAAGGPGEDRNTALAWRVRGETVTLLRAVRSHGHDAAIAGEPASVERAARLLGSYFREVFQCDPPALRACLGLAGGDGA
jgi:DNA repair protein RecO (recombination protein O)